MLTFSRQGGWPMIAAGIACGTVSLGTALWMFGAPSEPEWKQRLDRDVPPLLMSSASSVSEESLRLQQRILNDVLRRPMWTADEARELCDLLRAGYPRPLTERNQLSREELGAAMTHGAASVAVLARLELGAPMTPDARRIILHALEEELAADFPERRCSAAMALIVSRSIEDRFIRAQVEQLTEDADHETAEIIAMQLSHYDDQRSRALAMGQRLEGE
ncbi:MAG: hypothetical protein JNK58_13670 [Phycisphaerae bacterium]|nr:hypothetical protein [Phycisphaerae bacterium]